MMKHGWVFERKKPDVFKPFKELKVCLYEITAKYNSRQYWQAIFQVEIIWERSNRS